MQDQHVPAISRYYWPAFAVATLFGSNAGDLLVKHLSTAGSAAIYLPLLAVAFGAILYAEARDPAPTVRWYWLAIIIAPAAANHLADLSYLYLGVRRIWVAAGLLIVLVVSNLAFQSDTTRLIALRLQERPRPTVPLTDASYWIAMVVASTAGTLASDFLSLGLGLNLPLTSLILLVPVIMVAAVRRWTSINRTWSYWSLIVVLNALGIALGDLLAADPRFGIGPGPSVLSSAAVLAVLLLFSLHHDQAAPRTR